jgi:hypothetical protein
MSEMKFQRYVGGMRLLAREQNVDTKISENNIRLKVSLGFGTCWILMPLFFRELVNNLHPVTII